MTRYFYADPLAAAWMHENHGLAIVDCRGNSLKSESIVGGDLFPPFFIDPDSQHLLQPRRGDVFISERGGNVGMLPDQSFYDEGEAVFCGNDMSGPLQSRVRIIQRNGLAFMWPEVES